MTWAASVLTLYPEMFPGPLALALSGRALSEKIWSLEAINIRDFAIDKHGSVDDTPAGGGPGMVMRVDVLARAIDVVPRNGRPLWCLTPRGEPLAQAMLKAAAAGPGLILLCGRFEGIDERLFQARQMRQVSVGDYVLSGGEVPALLVLDGCVRLLPGVVGAPESLHEESFEAGLIEHAQYTRPQTFERLAIPEILSSGNHERIRAWRRAEADEATRVKRPDLWAKHLAERSKK